MIVTEITLKKGTGKPADNDLVEAEFALDVASGKIYSKLADGKVTALNSAEFIGVDTNADNYQYWQYKINGFSTTNVNSTNNVDFQSGDGIEIVKQGYGLKISAKGGAPEMHVGASEPASPEEGQLWLNTNDGYMYAYYGNAGNPTWMATSCA